VLSAVFVVISLFQNWAWAEPADDGNARETVDACDDRPRVSVVIPTHNRASQLEGALASVLASPLILSPAQVIVVDDDSRDRTPEVAHRHGARYVRVAAHSAAHSRNAGWKAASTEYVAFLDDDDAWLPGNMEPQLAALDARADAGFAYGIAQCADEDLQPYPATFPPPPLVSGHVPGELHRHYPQLGAALFRRDALEEVDGFDPRVHYWEDADLMIRVAARREILGVDVVGMLYRLREPSRQRCDYFWPLREVARWKPPVDGVGWRHATAFKVSTRGLFFTRFVEDAAAAARSGHRWDAVVCAARATWVSPLHAVRHYRYLLTACASPPISDNATSAPA